MFAIARIVRDQASNILASVGRVGPNFGERKMKSILDHNFRYTNSVETDVRKTFARVRREICRIERAQAAASAEDSDKVLHIAARRSVPRTGANLE